VPVPLTADDLARIRAEADAAADQPIRAHVYRLLDALEHLATGGGPSRCPRCDLPRPLQDTSRTGDSIAICRPCAVDEAVRAANGLTVARPAFWPVPARLLTWATTD
jgi:hypothetical protein